MPNSVTEFDRIANLETANATEETAATALTARVSTLELFKKVFALLAGDVAIPPHASGTFVITKGSAAALTLAAPVSGTEDGVELIITSNTAFAHVITATGLLQVGTVKTDVITFPAFAGGSIRLIAYLGKWNVMSNNLCILT